MKPPLFLLKVWKPQGKEGRFFCVSTKSKSGRWKDHFFEWPVRQDLQRFFKHLNMREFDVYFCPTPFNEPVRRKEYVIKTCYLWADLDEINPAQCEPKPSVAWESSPGRFASLWYLKTTQPTDKIEKINRNLTYKIGADKGGWDLTQVLRVPGTLNNKYKKKPRVKLLWFRKNRYSIKEFPKEDPLDAQIIFDKYHNKIPRPIRKAITTKKKPAIGKRSDMLWKIEATLSEIGMSPDEIFAIVKNTVWNKFKGRRNEDHQLRREIEKTVKEPEERTQIRDRPTLNSTVVRMDQIEAQSVEWIWYPYLPRGKLVIIEGDPGLGKSWITLAISSHLSQRRRLPGQKKARSGSCLIMSVEDGLRDTIKPRLDSLDANSRRIFAIPHPISFDDEGLEEIEEYIKEIRPIIVIVDPLVAFLGGDVDLHRANEVREVMAKLAHLAENHSTTIIAVRHLTKGKTEKSIYRGMGSIDLMASARSVMLVGKDPDDEDSRAIAHIKCNLAPLGRTVGYSLETDEKNPFIWTGMSDLSAEQIMSTSKTTSSERRMAEEFIDEIMKGKNKKDEFIVREAEARGISFGTLRKIRDKRGIKVIKGRWKS